VLFVYVLICSASKPELPEHAPSYSGKNCVIYIFTVRYGNMEAIDEASSGYGFS
jgi:hypothetical protein